MSEQVPTKETFSFGQKIDLNGLEAASLQKMGLSAITPGFVDSRGFSVHNAGNALVKTSDGSSYLITCLRPNNAHFIDDGYSPGEKFDAGEFAIARRDTEGQIDVAPISFYDLRPQDGSKPMLKVGDPFEVGDVHGSTVDEILEFDTGKKLDDRVRGLPLWRNKSGALAEFFGKPADEDISPSDFKKLLQNPTPSYVQENTPKAEAQSSEEIIASAPESLKPYLRDLALPAFKGTRIKDTLSAYFNNDLALQDLASQDKTASQVFMGILSRLDDMNSVADGQKTVVSRYISDIDSVLKGLSDDQAQRNLQALALSIKALKPAKEKGDNWSPQTDDSFVKAREYALKIAELQGEDK